MNNPLIVFLNTYGVFILLSIVFIYFYIKENKNYAYKILLASVLSILLGLVLKEIFNIPRPYIKNNEVALAGFSVRTTSLPSIHSALAFSIAGMVFTKKVKTGLMLVFIATIIGFGRIKANVHSVEDVLLGCFLGIFIALSIQKLSK